MLLATAVIAFASLLVTRDIFLSPLCCLAGTLSGAIVAGLVRGWGYAQFHACIPLAIGFSIPTLLLGLLMRRGGIFSTVVDHNT
jgi:hypothetical protein